MVINIEHCGNTVSSSIPIALKALIDDPDQRGKIVLLSGFGVGLSWATVIMKL
jgi:3-oxoacyl-[acyl-carrier-protein] synthase-3